MVPFRSNAPNTCRSRLKRLLCTGESSHTTNLTTKTSSHESAGSPPTDSNPRHNSNPNIRDEQKTCIKRLSPRKKARSIRAIPLGRIRKEEKVSPYQDALNMQSPHAPGISNGFPLLPSHFPSRRGPFVLVLVIYRLGCLPPLFSRYIAQRLCIYPAQHRKSPTNNTSPLPSPSSPLLHFHPLASPPLTPPTCPPRRKAQSPPRPPGTYSAPRPSTP